MKIYLTFLILLFAVISTAQCNDLYFSEYIEGSSSNKALEIYNPSAAAIDLTDYVIYRNNNGALVPNDSLFPSGVLSADAVFIIANASAAIAILDAADTTHTITFYNGNDAVWIKKISTGDTLDIIGEIGIDPGSGWPVGASATNNATLVRNIEIQSGQTNWAIGATEWMTFPIDTFDSLGTHTMTPCESCEETTSFLEIETCYSYIFPSMSDTVTDSGLYTDTLTNLAGCDSILTLNVTILEGSGSFSTVSVCDSYTSPDGLEEWTTSGVYFDTIPNMVGCDSAIGINLTVFYSTTSLLNIVACKNYTSPSGELWNSSGTYNDTILNSVGCDSLITINLTILNLDIIVTQSGATLTAENPGAFYQWLDCENDYAIIPGETEQTFIATENGSYAVQLSQDGCVDTSICNTVIGLTLTHNSAVNWARIYPNPTSENITIKWNVDQLIATVRVYDMYGRVMQVVNTAELVNLQIALEGEGGIYHIELEQTSGELQHYAIIKK